MLKESTADFIRHLQDIKLESSNVLVRWKGHFDVSEFLELIKETAFRVVRSSDGHVSLVRETGCTDDYSQQAGLFDFHTDGLYRGNPPEFVILHCLSPGISSNNTVLVDTSCALKMIRDSSMRSVLSSLDVNYVGKTGSIMRHSLIRPHPRTGEDVVNLGSRCYIVPKLHDITAIPTLRQITDAVGQLFAILDHAVVMEQNWESGDTIFFDNNRYLHMRRGSENDINRCLLRIWLST